MTRFNEVTPAVPDSMRFRPLFRGVSEDFEFLSEQGWLRFDDVMSWEGFLVREIPFEGRQTTPPVNGFRGWEGGVFEVADGFPRVASMDPSDGTVVFSPVKFFQWYRYDERLIRVKMKGVDLIVHPFTDLWLHPKYGRSWRFVNASDLAKLRKVTQSKFGLINKLSHDLYGDVDVSGLLGEEFLLPSFDGSHVKVRGSALRFDVDSPIRMLPSRHVSAVHVKDEFFESDFDEYGRRVVDKGSPAESVRVCNFIVPPFHNIIVRRGRKDDNPRTLWVGGPVAVGDGLDKSLLRVGGVANREYRALHPEWKNMKAREAWEAVDNFGDVRSYKL